jgi:hypothetical protein
MPWTMNRRPTCDLFSPAGTFHEIGNRHLSALRSSYRAVSLCWAMEPECRSRLHRLPGFDVVRYRARLESETRRGAGLFRMNTDAELARCDREIERIYQEAYAGNPDIDGMLLGLHDWRTEKILITRTTHSNGDAILNSNTKE